MSEDGVDTSITLLVSLCQKCPNSEFYLVRIYAETVPFHKISKAGNYVKLRYFCENVIIYHEKKYLNISQRF